MSIVEALHELVLDVPGVGTVYPADPAWRSTVTTLASVLGPGMPEASPTLVELRIEHSLAAVRVRVGANGQVPVPELARNVAAVLRRKLRDSIPQEVGTVTVQICSIELGHQNEPARAEPARKGSTARPTGG